MRCSRHVGISERIHVAVLIPMITLVILVMVLFMIFIMVLVVVLVMLLVMVRINDRTFRNFIAFHIHILVAIGEIQAT